MMKMRWLRRLFGGTGETFDEAYERILAELPPLKEQIADIEAHNAEAKAAREKVRRRLDGTESEYERGIEGLQ